MEDKTGGPAFPVTTKTTVRGGIISETANEGMTLRDYFAAKAMVAYLSQDGFMEAMEKDGVEVNEMTKAFYIWADAMLAERDK